MSDPKTYFLTKGLAKASDDISLDALHPKENAEIQHYSCTETQYLGFSIIEEGIHCQNYIWHHPKMNVLLGGSFAFQGYKPMLSGSELLDMRCFMSDSVLENGLKDYTLDTGYRSQILEPLKKFKVSYEDTLRNNSFEVELTAIMPPAVWPTGRHFEQAMHAKGEITLRGKRYKVDGYNVRDRSWGEARSEAVAPLPNVCWMTGIFGDDFAFNCNSLDHPDLNPIWKGDFHVPEENILIGGWVWIDGEIQPIVDTRKITYYDRRLMFPTDIELRAKIADGREFDFHGKVRACAPFNPWINVYAPIALTEWTCNGRTGHGESQDVQWTDFTNRYQQWQQ